MGPQYHLFHEIREPKRSWGLAVVEQIASLEDPEGKQHEISDGHLVFSSRNALAASTPRSSVRPLAGSHVLLDASPAPFSRSRSADVSGPTIWEK